MEALIGTVVIGRNEGARLRSCLESVLQYVNLVVYVDSGSTDDSVELAKQFGVDVVHLDLTIPFTAARARNEGFDRLQKLAPNLSFVQFIDGDCVILKGWFEHALFHFEHNSDVAVVCGRRRERYPETSIYNMLCDIEWNTAVGQTKACGGDSLMRATVFQQVAGFNPELIAGEEPELCVRIRQHGWKVWRLDADMTLHDANMTRFAEWWKRNVRSGFAFALGASMHGALPERHWVTEMNRARVWGAYIPLFILSIALIEPIGVVLAIIYPIQVIRIWSKNKDKVSIPWKYAFFVTLGKFPEIQGQFKFYLNKLFRLRSEIIEYKG